MNCDTWNINKLFPEAYRMITNIFVSFELQWNGLHNKAACSFYV